jgi:hypothetical protein
LDVDHRARRQHVHGQSHEAAACGVECRDHACAAACRQPRCANRAPPRTVFPGSTANRDIVGTELTNGTRTRCLGWLAKPIFRAASNGCSGSTHSL